MVTIDRVGEVLIVRAMPPPRMKLPKVSFYPVLVGKSGEWRVLAHCPGLPHKYISGFATRAEAEAWICGPDAQTWISANYKSGD
jgi:hypothetical protein